jgi:hypothetical protein
MDFSVAHGRRSNVAIAEQHAHPFRPRWARQTASPAARCRPCSPAARARAFAGVVDQEGVLERRAGAFHLGRRTGEEAGPPSSSEAAGRLPGARGIFRARVKRADAVLANHVEREALDRVMIEDQAWRHDQEVVVQGLATLGRDGLGLGVDGRHGSAIRVTPSGSQSVVWLTT